MIVPGVRVLLISIRAIVNIIDVITNEVIDWDLHIIKRQSRVIVEPMQLVIMIEIRLFIQASHF